MSLHPINQWLRSTIPTASLDQMQWSAPFISSSKFANRAGQAWRSSTSSSSIAQDIVLSYLDPYPLSGISLGINVIFFAIFFSVLLFMIVYLARARVRDQMMRNQKIMLSLVIVLLLFQCSGLVVRTVYDALNIDTVHHILAQVEVLQGKDEADIVSRTMNTTVTAFDAGINDSTIIAMYLMGSFEVLTIVLNIAVITAIMSFVSYVFVKTVRLASGAFTKMQYSAILAVIVGGGIGFGVILCAVILTVAITYFVIKIRVAQDFQLPIFVVCYVVYVIQIFLQTIVFNVVSISVLRMIKRRSSDKNRKKSQLPFLKVIALQMGLTLCALIQVIAIGCSAVMSEWVYMKVFYYIFNCVGILLFASLILPLYHPLFTGTAAELKELKFDDSQSQKSDKEPSSTVESGLDSARSPRKVLV